MTAPRWLDDRQQRAWRGYLRMQARLPIALNRQLQAESDLSLADFEVLAYLSEIPEARVRVTELARALQWEQSRASHHLARMQKRGLVDRAGCPDDRRGAFVVLTAAGRAAIGEAAPRHVEHVRQLIFDRLTDDDVDALTRITDRVLDALTPDTVCTGSDCDALAPEDSEGP